MKFIAIGSSELLRIIIPKPAARDEEIVEISVDSHGLCHTCHSLSWTGLKTQALSKMPSLKAFLFLLPRKERRPRDNTSLFLAVEINSWTCTRVAARLLSSSPLFFRVMITFPFRLPLREHAGQGQLHFEDLCQTERG